MRAQAIMRNILLALLALCFGAATAAKQALGVTDMSTCALCNRRVGNAVFVQRPQGDVVHFLCYKKSMRGAPSRT